MLKIRFVLVISAWNVVFARNYDDFGRQEWTCLQKPLSQKWISLRELLNGQLGLPIRPRLTLLCAHQHLQDRKSSQFYNFPSNFSSQIHQTFLSYKHFFPTENFNVILGINTILPVFNILETTNFLFSHFVLALLVLAII